MTRHRLSKRCGFVDAGKEFSRLSRSYFVGGHYRESASTTVTPVLDPTNVQQVGEIAECTAAPFVVGKPLGILLTCWAACRLRVGALPRDSTWTTLAGAAVCAGIGFTVALFITRLSLTAPADQDAARLGILAASVLSALAGLLFVVLTSRRSSSPRPCTSTRIGSTS